LLGYHTIGRRPFVCFNHQDTQDPLAPLTQPEERLPQTRVLILGENSPVSAGDSAQQPVKVVILNGNRCPCAALEGPALPPTSSRQPTGKPPRIPDSVQILQQPEPGQLRDIGGIICAQPMRPADCPYQSREAFHQLIPRAGIAARRREHPSGDRVLCIASIEHGTARHIFICHGAITPQAPEMSTLLLWLPDRPLLMRQIEPVGVPREIPLREPHARAADP
jgi:hypothetical protein